MKKIKYKEKENYLLKLNNFYIKATKKEKVQTEIGVELKLKKLNNNK